MADNNFRLYLMRPKKILNFFGVWPTEEQRTFPQIIFNWIYTGIILFTQYSFLFFEFIYIADVIGDMDELTESSFLLFTQASLCYKTTVFLLTRKNLITLLKLMNQDIFLPRNQLHKKRLNVQARKIRRLCLFFLISANTTCSLWALIPLFDNNGPRIFPFKIWMPFGPESSPDYVLGYLYQMVSIYVSACIFCAVDNVTLALIMFGCAQIEIIGDKLQEFQNVSTKLKPEVRKRILKENSKVFVDCIKHHQAVVQFIEMVENTYHAYIFFQLSGTVAIICIIGLRISVVEPNSVQFTSMVNYFMTMLSQLFLYCWCGQELTIRSENLREWLYKCPWYEQDLKFRRSLWIALQRMTKPIIFKAGHYIPLSRPTFVQILRSSYSYFAVLKQTK